MTPLVALWTALTMGLAAPDLANPERGSLKGLQLVPVDERTELVLSIDGEVQTRDFTMEGPNRLVVDLMGARHELGSERYDDLYRGGVRSIRASQYSEDVVRVTLELDELVDYNVRSGEGWVRISLENSMGMFEPWQPAAAAAATAAPETELNGTPAPEVRRRASSWSGVAPNQATDRVRVSFMNTPIREVIFFFSDFADRSIVLGSGVTGTVSTEIRDQPWDVALQAILDSHGLAAQEEASGIIRIDALGELQDRSELEPLVTRPFRISYTSAADFSAPIESLLSERGRVEVHRSTNSLVVTDIPRVLDQVEDLIEGIDIETPEISISARIIFVNRTDLEEFGVVYDLKDSRGNRMSSDAPIPTGNEVSLGGNSIAAIGNASQRVQGPQLEFLTSLILGRHTLVSFVEALQSVNLTDVQASPQVRVLENQTARILVGERTPIPTVQPAAPGQEGQVVFQPPTIQFQETGIILEVTPQVTAGNLIYMQLRAERSGVEIADTQIGFIFNTQEAETFVLVEDGETVVIGGLTVTELTELRAGIPLLMNLPVMGRFFRLSREQRNQRDLMILVTPQINRR